jgi:hypothetical protein
VDATEWCLAVHVFLSPFLIFFLSIPVSYNPPSSISAQHKKKGEPPLRKIDLHNGIAAAEQTTQFLLPALSHHQRQKEERDDRGTHTHASFASFFVGRGELAVVVFVKKKGKGSRKGNARKEAF